MAQKCLHKGCGKTFEDPNEQCAFHPGPPVFHEGQKGWDCCKPRVLTFEEFMSIPGCTTGKHSTVEEKPATKTQNAGPDPKLASLESALRPAVPRTPAAPRNPAPVSTPAAPAPAPAELESDDPSLQITPGAQCRRRGCTETYDPVKGREGEKCIHHPGHPLFHEGSKGWTCCKRRVLEFDTFLKLEGCTTKDKHIFIGKGKDKNLEEKLETVRSDYYQTTESVIASFYLKKIDAKKSRVEFKSSTIIDVDLLTADNKRYTTEIPLYGEIIPEKCKWKIMGTKLEFTLAKADASGWPVLRSTDPMTGEIIQSGRAGSLR